MPRHESGIPETRYRSVINWNITCGPTFSFLLVPRDSSCDGARADQALHGTRAAGACNVRAVRPRASDLVRTLRSACQPEILLSAKYNRHASLPRRYKPRFRLPGGYDACQYSGRPHKNITLVNIIYVI